MSVNCPEQTPPSQDQPSSPTGLDPKAPKKRKPCLPSAEEMGSQVVVALVHPMTAIISIGALLVGIFILSPLAHGPAMCAFKTSTNLPCPGCGLTRSVTCILHGKFLAAWEYNPFGYGFTFFFLITAPVIFLKKKYREVIARKLKPMEKPFAYIFFSLVFGLLLFGVVRLTLVQLNISPYSWWKHGEVPPSLREEYPYGKQPADQGKSADSAVQADQTDQTEP
jgi:Protein of unknown function (DUF2752)